MSQRDNNLQKLSRRIERILPSRKGNVKVITLCVVAATTFWFFSALNKENYTTRIRYPVTFNYPSDSGIFLLSELPEDVTVQVTGGGWDLLKKTLGLNTAPIEVSLEAPTETKYVLGRSLAERISNQLDNLRLDYVVTDTLRINIDSARRKGVEIVIDPQSLQLAENYQLVSDVVVSPSRVEVWGPASLVNQLSDTLALAVGDDEISGRVETTLEIPVNDEKLTVYPDEVMVNLTAELFTRVERRTSVEPVNFPEDSSVYLSQDFVTVSFWLPDNLISPALNRLAFQAQTNLETLNRKDSTVVVELVDIPAIVSNIKINPSRLPVRYAP